MDTKQHTDPFAEYRRKRLDLEQAAPALPTVRLTEDDRDRAATFKIRNLSAPEKD